MTPTCNDEGKFAGTPGTNPDTMSTKVPECLSDVPIGIGGMGHIEFEFTIKNTGDSSEDSSYERE